MNPGTPIIWRQFTASGAFKTMRSEAASLNARAIRLDLRRRARPMYSSTAQRRRAGVPLHLLEAELVAPMLGPIGRTGHRRRA
jgi:hypothetical protein